MKIRRKLAQPRLPVVGQARTRNGHRRRLSTERLENRHLLTTIYSDILDNDGSWSFTGTGTLLWPDNNDLVPFSNESVQAGNDFAFTHSAGTYELKKTFPGVTWQPGDYVFDVDVFARKNDSWLTGDVNVQDHGLTANGVHVAPTVHVRPDPQGTPWGWVTWSYQYSVGATDPIVGQAMGFDVDFSLNTAGELGFDNVRIASGSCSTTVTNTDDTGTGSLRDAIVCSNTTVGLDTIDFDLPGAAGPHTIQPLSALPTVTDAVNIDGYTQAGSAPSTNLPADGSNANLQVILDGSMAGAGANGLTVTAGGSMIRGLVINQFDGNGIQISGAGGNWVHGNFIGTDVTGSTAAGNGDNGIRIFGASAGSNTIGTDGDGTGDAGEANVISANGADAGSATRQNILIFQSNTQNVIAGNLIGTNAAGTSGLANGGVGIDISDGSDSARIGTNGDGTSDEIERNVISANNTAGIRLRGAPSVSGTVISGNFIGTDAAGTGAIGNTGVGIQLSRAVQTQIGTNGDGQNDAVERNIVSGNTLDGILISGQPQSVASPGENTVAGNHIGADITGFSALANGANGIRIETDNLDNQIGGVGTAGNTIAFNGLRGVQVGPTVSGVSILGNSTHSNGELGIDLNNDGVTSNDSGDGDSGANGLQNFPVLTSATSGGGSTTVSGVLNSTASSNFTLEFFANASSDPSGFGEGETFIGSTSVSTDASGNASFVVTFPVSVPLGQTVTATATNAAGNTSEFSGNALVSDTKVEFSAASYADGEGAGTSTVMTLERTDDSVVSEVQVNIVGGTALGGNVDYDDSDFPRNITFNVGELTKQVPVSFVQENLVELDETIQFEVVPISGATIGLQNTSTLTIQNDDAAAFSVSSESGFEDDGPITFTVALSAEVDAATSVDISTSDGTALLTDSDYVQVSGLTLHFAAGATSQTFDVTVNDDNFVETDETFFVDLTGLQANGRDVTFAVGGNQGLGTISNDDFAPIADADGPYGILEGQPLTLDASGSSDPDGDPLTYRWDVDGDGDFDENITGVNPTLPWASLASLGIDDGPDGPRTITVEVSDGTNMDSASTTLSVDNDDPTADDDMGSVSEDGPAVTIDVLNNDSDPAGANDPLTVTGVNAAGTLGLVSFTGGDVTYDPNGQFESLDAGDSVTDSFQYSISDGDGGVATATVTVTILGENDAPTVANPIDDVMANEDAIDEIIDLSNVFADVDADDTLTLSVTGNTNPSLLGAAIVGTDLVLDYLLDQSGLSEITIRATDSAGLFVEDTFSVTVLSASEQIQNILTKVQAFQGVNTNGLQSKLNGAMNKLAADQDNAAANQLNAFINQINAFVNSGKLTAQQGAECIESAQDAISSITEGNGST